MEPTKELIRQLWREQIEAARRMPPEQKLRAGGDLFDAVVQRMTAGIRAQFPQMSDEEVNAELRRRLAINKRLEEKPWRATGS